MKKQKITALTIALLTSVSLCGCNNENQSSDSGSRSTVSLESTDRDTSSQTGGPEDPESSDTPSGQREKIVLIGALNDEIDRKEIVKASRIEPYPLDDTEISPDRIDEDRADRATVGFAYCALPLYPALTNRESEYNEENRSFKDIPQQEKSDYIKARPGDNICGLTVAKAATEFFFGENGGRTKMSYSYIKLNGSITVEGYIRILTELEYATGMDGDLIFVPVGDVQLPTVRFDSREDNPVSIEFRSIGNPYMMDDLIFTNEFSGFIQLGNINETTADISEIPNDGSFVKVRAVISDFEIQSTIGWFTNSYAVLESVTRID